MCKSDLGRSAGQGIAFAREGDAGAVLPAGLHLNFQHLLHTFISSCSANVSVPPEEESQREAEAGLDIHQADSDALHKSSDALHNSCNY